MDIVGFCIMVLKAQLLHLLVKFGKALAEDIQGMRMALWLVVKAIFGIKWRKYFKWAGRILSFGVTVTGAVTAASSASSAGTGAALSAIGATGAYVTTKNPAKGYEKIRHVSPALNRRSSEIQALQPPGSVPKKRNAVPKPMFQKRV